MKKSLFPTARYLLTGALVFALEIASSGAVAHAQDAFVRVLHGLNLTEKVDVIIDGKKRFNDLEFGGVSPYVRLDGGAHSITIQTNNPTRNLLSVRRRFSPYDFHTLSIYGTPRASRFVVANDSAGNPQPNRAQLTAYNLSPDAGPFDVVTYQPGGKVLVLMKNVRYGAPKRANIPAIPMTVRLVRRGAILKTLKGASPRAGRKYALYAVGRAGRNFRALLDVTASQ